MCVFCCCSYKLRSEFSSVSFPSLILYNKVLLLCPFVTLSDGEMWSLYIPTRTLHICWVSMYVYFTPSSLLFVVSVLKLLIILLVIVYVEVISGTDRHTFIYKKISFPTLKQVIVTISSIRLIYLHPHLFPKSIYLLLLFVSLLGPNLNLLQHNLVGFAVFLPATTVK